MCLPFFSSAFFIEPEGRNGVMLISEHEREWGRARERERERGMDPSTVGVYLQGKRGKKCKLLIKDIGQMCETQNTSSPTVFEFFKSFWEQINQHFELNPKMRNLNSHKVKYKIYTMMRHYKVSVNAKGSKSCNIKICEVIVLSWVITALH